MNISQGIYRIAQLIKWGGRILGAIYFFGLMYAALTNQEKANSDLFLFLGLFAVFIAITEGMAWVLEGFSRD